MQNIKLAGLAAAASLAALATPAAAQADCDRACLLDLMDTYLHALVAGEPDRLPIADNVRFVENIEARLVGEGLWRNASDLPGEFEIRMADPVAGQTAFMGMLGVDGEFRLTTVRLKVENGAITQIEHLIAPSPRPEMIGNLQDERPVFSESVSPSLRDSRAQMTAIAESYYEALVNSDGSITPFGPDCVRHENGMQVTVAVGTPPEQAGRLMDCTVQLDSGIMSYITRIEERRVEMVDEELGLVMAFSQFRHPMEQDYVDVIRPTGPERLELDYEPFDLPAAHIFKIYDGQMHEIEAMGFMAPYNAPTGWE